MLWKCVGCSTDTEPLPKRWTLFSVFVTLLQVLLWSVVFAERPVSSMQTTGEHGNLLSTKATIKMFLVRRTLLQPISPSKPQESLKSPLGNTHFSLCKWCMYHVSGWNILSNMSTTHLRNLWTTGLFTLVCASCACACRSHVCIKVPSDLCVISVPHVHHIWSRICCFTVSVFQHSPTIPQNSEENRQFSQQHRRTLTSVPSKNTHRRGMNSFKVPSRFLDLSCTGESKIHLNGYGSNLICNKIYQLLSNCIKCKIFKFFWGILGHVKRSYQIPGFFPAVILSRTVCKG